MKPRRKPVRNPPICAKLSTCGNIPIARLMTIINRSVTKAATYKIQKNGVRNEI
jgi:hypothetical protein